MLAAVRAAADRPRVRVPRAVLERRLRDLGQRHIRRTRTSARRLIGLLGEFGGRGVTPLADAIGTGTPACWEQYGAIGERTGRAGGLFFYYHSHDRAPAGEHGHFHLFTALPSAAGQPARYAHLVAIGVDARGLPRRLFTTNRWVTGETWIDANAASAALGRILAAPAPRAVPLERWVRELIAVFVPQIKMLLECRDQRVAVRGGPRRFEDRRMYVLSECQVSLDEQVSAIDSVFR